MPDLITLELETPADPTTSEEPGGQPADSSADDIRTLPAAVLENLPPAATMIDLSPAHFPNASQADARQPVALTEVSTGNPETDPSTDNAALFAVDPATRSLSPNAQPVHVHKARLQDARNIFDLVNSLSHDGTLLRRSYAEICENIRDFTVAETVPESGNQPHFLGCGALHLYGPHLAEVRSIVLYPEARGQGAGAALLRALLAESEDHGVATTCLFTRLPNFFERYGFRVAERNAMPDKIYKDCQACPRLYACDEVAMVKGPLPQTAVLGPTQIQQPELVQVQIQVQLHPVLR